MNSCDMSFESFSMVVKRVDFLPTTRRPRDWRGRSAKLRLADLVSRIT
jgi:hypothetical protein